MKKYILFILMAFIITYTFFGVDVRSIGEYICGTSDDVVYYSVYNDYAYRNGKI